MWGTGNKNHTYKTHTNKNIPHNHNTAIIAISTRWSKSRFTV